VVGLRDWLDSMPYHALAIVFLSILVLTPAVAAVIALKYSPFTPPQSLLFFFAVLLTRILWRAQLPDRLPVPSGQGAILICNHRSSVDPFFIQVCSWRPIHWMVAKEYCEHPALRWFLKICEVIPVNRRGIDTAATRTAIRLAATGGFVGMLPEGRINMSDHFMNPVRPGAVLVAIKARVPIVPVYIQGSPFDGTVWGALRMAARVKVHVGEPIDLSAYYESEKEEGVVSSLILYVVHQIAVLAGRAEFRPRLAGRQWRPSNKEQTALVESVQRKLKGKRPQHPTTS